MEQHKKGLPPWIKRMIIPLIAVGFVVGLVMSIIPWHMITRSPNSAAQTFLQQLSTAEVAFSVDHKAFVVGVTANDINELIAYGLRPDSHVGFVILPQLAASNSNTPGFIAFAAHRAKGSILFIYDYPNGDGVQPATAASYGGVARPEKLTLFRFNNGVLESSGSAQFGLKNGKVNAPLGDFTWTPVK
ncbi:MAG: hypothetical protein LBV79_05825 [Candidatus Adiutrix sp.]|jgi:hypothetical protein|nr:hypothetical protein [Candidatus Adiutrix sp.]